MYKNYIPKLIKLKVARIPEIDLMIDDVKYPSYIMFLHRLLTEPYTCTESNRNGDNTSYYSIVFKDFTSVNIAATKYEPVDIEIRSIGTIYIYNCLDLVKHGILIDPTEEGVEKYFQSNISEEV